MKMIDRPNGYFSTWDPLTGRKLEGETRSCIHCGYMWIYSPQSFSSMIVDGSDGRQMRGKCLKCFGLVCARPECLKNGCIPLAKQIEDMEHGPDRRPIIYIT